MAHNKKETLDTMFCGVGLCNPRNGYNIGGVIRAIGAFNVSFLASSGTRYKELKSDFRNMDTEMARKRIPCFLGVNSLHDFIPHDCVPVAIEKNGVDDQSLIDFEHPRRAFYIFGPEDGSVSEDLLDVCQHKVYIPTASLNLQVCVHIVLYDRLVKMMKKNIETIDCVKCPECGSIHHKVVESPPVYTENDWYHCNACGYEADANAFMAQI